MVFRLFDRMLLRPLKGFLSRGVQPIGHEGLQCEDLIGLNCSELVEQVALIIKLNLMFSDGVQVFGDERLT